MGGSALDRSGTILDRATVAIMEPLDRADLIYHETQEGALCGVHALNTLLQAPHFSELDLATIAHELDAAERELMGGDGIEGEFGNLDDSGMFSSQVLARALEVFGLQAVPLRSPDAADARADPTTQQAFICNLQEHWFTVRAIHGQWWNLNSVYGSPEPLSAFHLAAYLGSLQEEGYTIFVITGDLPQPQLPTSEEERAVPGLAGRWITPDEARAATEERKQLKEQGYAKATVQGVLGKASEGEGTWMVLRRPGAKRALEDEGQGDDMQGDDPELARALAASMADHPGGSSGGAQLARGAWGAPRALPAQHGDDEDADLAAAIAASLADGSGSGDPALAQQQQAGSAPADDAMPVDEDEDPELAAAIAASLQHQQEAQPAAEAAGAERAAAQQPAAAAAPVEQPAASAAPAQRLPELGAEPEAGEEGAIEVALRLPGGGRASRRFRAAEDTVGHLAAFAAAQLADVAGGRCQLAAGFPRRVLADWDASLADAGVGHKELVTVEMT